MSSTQPATTLIDWPAQLVQERAWISAWVRRRTGSSEYIDEIMQEVSLACLQASNLPTEEMPMRAWLARVVVRQCALLVRRNMRRERKHQALQSQSNGHTSATGVGNDPMLKLLASERREAIQHALTQLDSVTRNWLVKKYVHGESYETIAAQAGTTRHVIEHRLKQARQQLQELLMDHADEQMIPRH